MARYLTLTGFHFVVGVAILGMPLRSLPLKDGNMN